MPLASLPSRTLATQLLAVIIGLATGGILNADESPKPALPRETWPPAPVQVINEELSARWKEKGLIPSRPAGDHEFIRRASLDLIGRIATPEEIRRFLNDPPAGRRAALIERLLHSPEYARNWGAIWTVWLMSRSSPSVYQEQLHTWLEGKLARSDLGFDTLCEELLTATGKTTENGAVNYVLAHLGEPIPPNKRAEEGEFTMVPLTSRTTRLFLGLQIQCAQCHDHPLNHEWKQQHFWGINAFFRQVERKGTPVMARQAPPAVLELTDNLAFNSAGLIFFERRNGVVLPARSTFLDGARVAPQSSHTRRQDLAEFIVHHENFGKAFVNRMWGHFFGRGLTITGAVDDFGEHNPETYPKLLEYLGRQFQEHHYRPRELLRWICNSEAYGLSSLPNRSNDKPDADTWFSRMPLRTLSPEQLFESLMIVTRAESGETPKNQKRLREEWMRNLIVNFGDDEGNEASFNGTVVQALMLMNGPEINQAIAHRDRGPIITALKSRASPKAVVDDLFLTCLNRHPTQTEFQDVSRRMAMRVADKDATAPLEDLVWALLNSSEFILNH
jgi:hypothetical protein